MIKCLVEDGLRMARKTERVLRFGFFIAGAFLLFSFGIINAQMGWPPSALYRDSIKAIAAIKTKFVATILPVLHSDHYTGKVTVLKAGAVRGYTLYTTNKSSRVYLIDMDGAPVYEWNLPFEKIWPNPTHIKWPVHFKNIFVDNAYLYPNGDILAVYYAKDDTPYGYGLAKIDKNSKLVWALGDHIHHDVYVADNGNIYTLRQYIQEEPIAGAQYINYPALVDSIEILNEAGKSLDSISIVEAFVGTPYEQFLYNDILQDAKGDILHTNSVKVLEKSVAPAFPQFKIGQILVSLRNQDMIAVIDPNSKKVVWAAKGAWKAQHDAHFLKNGHISLFDNIGFNNGQYPFSRILEINPRTNGIEWFYTQEPEGYFYSEVRGSAQPLANGNMLISESTSSRMFELTRNKEVVWRFELPQLDNLIILESAKRVPYGYAKFLKD